jgi:hypothetical protein
MLFYFTLFLSFLYFKIARVHKKEEKLNAFILVQHIVVALAIIGLFVYGFYHMPWYFLIFAMLLFLIMASLIITTIQLGIFVDGKPLFGIGKIYSYLPLLGISITFLSAVLWSI